MIALVRLPPDDARSTPGSSSTGAPTASSASATRTTLAPVVHLYVAAAALPLRAADAADGLRVPGAAARGARRAAQQRAQGRARCRPRTSRAASPAACWSASSSLQCLGTARDAAPADARGARVRGRRLALRRAAASRSRRSRSSLLAAALPGREELWRRLHGRRDRAAARSSRRTRPASSRSPTRDAGALPPLGQRQGQQLAAVRRRPHGARRAARRSCIPAPRRVAVDRPRLRRHGLGRGLPARDGAPSRCSRSRSPQPRILRRVAGAGAAAGARGLPGRPARRAPARGRPPSARGERGEAYDAIETDAIWPESAGSGNLYSLEFFETCARRLRPGGLMCTWAPTPRVRATFRSVFPHVLDADGGVILVGSRYPLQLDVAGVGGAPAKLRPRTSASSGRRRSASSSSSLMPAAGPDRGPAEPRPLPARRICPLAALRSDEWRSCRSVEPLSVGRCPLSVSSSSFHGPFRLRPRSDACVRPQPARQRSLFLFLVRPHQLRLREHVALHRRLERRPSWPAPRSGSTTSSA